MLLQGNQGQAGKLVGQGQTVSLGEFGDTLVSEYQARYYEQVYRNNTFFTSVAAAAGTAYTGGAGGTPLVAIYNPTNSGVNLVVKTTMVSVVATASAAGLTQFRLYGGQTVLPTGTFVTPFSALTLTATGSKAKAVNNVAMTSASALNYITTVGTYQFSVQLTSGGPTYMLCPPIAWDAAGQLIVQPGNTIALGAVTIPTSMTNDAAIFWDEVPV
jgi:hypothetical protein